MTDESALPQSAVIYTDGSCNAKHPGDPASRGWAGWGIHGYFFTNEPPKTGAGAKKGVPTAKGYDIAGTGKGDITVTSYVDGVGSVPGEGTNNIAELMAAREAVKVALTNNISVLTIRSDSRYVVDGATHIKRMRDNKFRKSDGIDVANRELWMDFSDNLEKLEDQGAKINFVWVKGHNGKAADPGNTLADCYARRGTLSNRENKPVTYVEISQAKGYWNKSPETNPMLSLANWYLSLNGQTAPLSPTGKFVYYLGDIRAKEEFLGKPLTEASFAVVYLKEPEPILEHMRNYFAELGKGIMQGLLVANLNALYQPTVHDTIMWHGSQFIVFDKAKQVIEHMDKAKDEDRDGIDLGHEIRPTRLAYNAVEILNDMELLLNDYLQPREPSKIRRTDITSLLYERHEAIKNKSSSVKLHKSITVGSTGLEAELTYDRAGKDGTKPVNLIFAQDLPSRNALNSMVNANLKVTALTWPESSSAFRYAIVIECGNDVGIWCSPYSNLQTLA